MVLKERIALMAQLGQYFLDNNEEWKAVKKQAFLENSWFLPEYIDKVTQHIAHSYLQQNLLENWIAPYPVFTQPLPMPEVGIVMAGNIPLVGFHDFLASFISGCRQRIKLSSKDKVLWSHIALLLKKWNKDTENLFSFTDQLKNCDAYIATGSNNSARYFDYYFAKYPHIIRRNRSSAAILSGNETTEMLAGLVDDICLYFGLGCRNATQLFVPENYDFSPLEAALNRYDYHLDYSKYKNNYDYQLALILLNKMSYRTATPVLLVPSDSLYAPLGVVHYKTYDNLKDINKILPAANELQCLIAQPHLSTEELPIIPFGQAQSPALTDYADGVNTLSFLSTLKNNQTTIS